MSPETQPFPGALIPAPDALIDTAPLAKPCSKCGAVKPLADFHRRTRSRTGRQSQCRACRRKVVAPAAPVSLWARVWAWVRSLAERPE
jgi:hypothetical protein